MKVLVVTNMYPSIKYPVYGSFVQVMVDALENFEQVSCNVVFISERKTGVVKNAIKYLSLFIKIFKATLFTSYDVVNVHYIFPTGMIALPAVVLRKKPLVFTSHGGDVRLGKKNKLLKGLTRFLLRRADRIIAVSEFLALELQKEFLVPPGKIEVINCGVDTTLFYPRDKESSKEYLGYSTQEKWVLFVGNLIPLKGLLPLFQAFQKISIDFPMARLMVIGEGPLREQLASMAEESSIAEKVRLLGAIPHTQIPLWMAAADVFVLPSSQEGFGLVALEAMACGTPVVASRVGGLSEFVDSGKNGYLVEPGDVEGLVKKISMLLKDEPLRARLALEARKESLTHDLRSQAKKIQKIFKEII